MTQPSTIAPGGYSPILSARAVAFPDITLPANHVLIFPMAGDGTVWCERCRTRLNAERWAQPCPGKEPR